MRSPRLCPAGWAILLALVIAPPASAGWASLGAFPQPAREGESLLFRSEQGVAAVSVLAPEIVRVRFSPTRSFGRDHSYAVIRRDLGPAGASFRIGGAESVITTRALRVTIRHAPFRVAFATASGASLDEDDPELGTALAGRRVKVWKRLRDDERIYGFGEKAGRLDKRGWQLGGYSYTMWNTDSFAYDAGGTDPIYATVPFFIVLRGGRAHGIFLDNTFRSSFDVGHESPGLLSMGVLGGELNYYFIDGPSPKQVIERYTALTGRMPLPPLWALGYHQCRYSYYPEAKVRFVADNFRQRRIPADVIWLDIHYLDSYKPFSWDRERFPDPQRMIAELLRQGFRVVTIIDPHPKKEPGAAPYDSGLAGDHFVRNPDGTVYEADVWPANAERNPGKSVFPDFSKPAAREWWGGLHRELVSMGVAGIWNDMNEPAVFVEPAHTMPLEARHHNEGQPTDHREIHNVYGMLMTRATYEGLLRLRPGARPFVLTRASYAGGQRYAALWPGDNVSDWGHLRGSIPMLLGMGLSGLPFVGSDIGGFVDSPSPELFTRWLQAGVFYPFMRSHTMLGSPDQEPWSFGTRHEAINRRAIELRYELLPHLYNLMREASETGVPPLRPLFLEHPDDPQVPSLDDQVLLGSDLLVAPVLREGATERELYLPAGAWYDFWTGERVLGGQRVTRPVTLESIPIFAREGAFVFRQAVVQHTGEMPGQPLRVFAYPAQRSFASLYEDQGDGFAYREGQYLVRRFSQLREGSSVRFSVSAPEGRFRPAARRVELVSPWHDPEPARVLAAGRPLSKLESPDSGALGWRLVAGHLVIRLEDSFEALEIAVERQRP